MKSTRIHLSLAILALGALCLAAPGLSAADQPTLPQDWAPFAGTWEVDNLPVMPSLPSWLKGENGGFGSSVPASELVVDMVDGKPNVILTRFKLKVDVDGTFRYLPVRQFTAKAQVEGDALVFRIRHDTCVPEGQAYSPIDTEWRFEVKDQQAVLRSTGSSEPTQLPAPLAMKRAPYKGSAADGC
jgi:hypothetical protein